MQNTITGTLMWNMVRCDVRRSEHAVRSMRRLAHGVL